MPPNFSMHSDASPAMTRVTSLNTSLPAGVSVWTLPLHDAPLRLAWALRLLTPEERARFRRLKRRGSTARRAVCRAALRSLLGAELRRDPTRLQLHEGSWGKPKLLKHKNLHFNLSHSGELAVIALSYIGPVGVDIELRREGRDLLGIANLAFSPREARVLAALTGEARITCFYNLWCAKEASMKADGRGLSTGLSQTRDLLSDPELCLGAHATASTHEDADFNNEDSAPEKRWRLWRLHLPRTHSACLALSRTPQEQQAREPSIPKGAPRADPP